LTRQLQLAALVLLLFLVPLFVTSNFYLHMLIMTAVNIIMATSLWLILRSGQLSIGHAAFMAIGAYTSALLTMRAGLPFPLAMPLAGVMAAVIAVLVGYPSLRLKGLFFALVTFAFAEIVRIVFKSFGGDLFGGASGISAIPHPSFFGIELASRTSYYYLALPLMLLTILVIYRIDKSRIGMNLVAISQADALAESLGINIMKYKVVAFVIGSFFAGVAGSFFAHYLRHISPESFTFWFSVYALIYVVVGGLGSIAGPIVGACTLSVFSESFRTFGDYEPIVFGVALILVVMFLREGVVSLPQRASLLVRILGDRFRGIGPPGHISG
jgi:branched-chain amino acid transport system permease protein